MDSLDNRVLVLGIGNILLKDDGVGPRVVRELEEYYKDPNVTFLDGGTLGIDLLAYIEDYNYLLIIDAVDFGKQPGDITVWHGNKIKSSTGKLSFHQVGLKELLHTIELLDLNLEVIVIGVQIEDVSWGMELTESVEKAVPLIKGAIINQVKEVLANAHT